MGSMQSIFRNNNSLIKEGCHSGLTHICNMNNQDNMFNRNSNNPRASCTGTALVIVIISIIVRIAILTSQGTSTVANYHLLWLLKLLWLLQASLLFFVILLL